MDSKTALLALNRIQGMGPKRIQLLQRNLDNWTSLFRCSPTKLQSFGIPEAAARAITQFDFSIIETDYHWSQYPNHHILSWDDEHYPNLLKEINSPPPILYAKGDLASLNTPAIAIVGSRRASFHGQEHARYFAHQLANAGLTIVSGLARGIDGYAHQGCLEASGKTIAVMATGIDRIYPAQHQQLAEKIEQNGLLISEFPLKKAPQAGHFPQRNRIISGLTLSTLVVEAAIKSGSLITARYALEQNRDVLAIPGSIKNPLSRGCHHLLQQGAKLVTSVADVMDELNISVPFCEQSRSETILSLAKPQEILVKCLGYDVIDVDSLCQSSGLTLEVVMAELTCLEVMGLIKSVPGGYIRC